MKAGMVSVLWDKVNYMHLQCLVGTRAEQEGLCKILEVLFNPQNQEHCPRSWKNNRSVYCQTAQNGWLMQLSEPLSPSRTICPNWKGMSERHGKTQLNQSHASFKIRAGRKPGIHCMRQKFTNVLIHLPVKLSGHPEQRPSCLWREEIFRQADLPPYVAQYADEV